MSYADKRQDLPLSVSLKIIEDKYLRLGIILNIPKHNYAQATDKNRGRESNSDTEHVSNQDEYKG